MIDINRVNFEKLDGLIVAVVQDIDTLQVLMVGFMNYQALVDTQNTKKVTFFSRTKNRLWQKGETSGNFLNVREIYLDCDNDSILVMAKPVGNTCHTGSNSCFIQQQLPALSEIGKLNKTILDRITIPTSDSYTNLLISRGLNKIAQKVGEEAVEVVIAAINESEGQFLGEVTDLIYHILVLLTAKNLTLDDLAVIINKRQK